MLAYLVIREGSKWTDVFRLIPGQAITVGRAPTNQIVIKDERCSRCHAEVFLSQGTWTLRDLESRNGTLDRIGNGSRRLHAAAGRRHPHRPVATRLRPRSVQGLSRFEPPAAAGADRRRNRRQDDLARRVLRRRRRAGRIKSRPRSRIAAARPSFSNRTKKSTTTTRRFRVSVVPRPRFAGWPLPWPRRPTSARWPTWR